MLAIRIRNKWPTIQIIITSGRPWPEEAVVPPDIPFFSKPYRQDRVLDAVRKWLRDDLDLRPSSNQPSRSLRPRSQPFASRGDTLGSAAKDSRHASTIEMKNEARGPPLCHELVPTPPSESAAYKKGVAFTKSTSRLVRQTEKR